MPWKPDRKTMPQLKPPSLSPWEIAQKSKEIHERLQYVKAEEAKLSDLATELKVIENTIAIKQKQLDTLNENLEGPDRRLVEEELNLKKSIRLLERQEARLREQFHPIEQNIADIKLKLKQSRSELADINKEITQRRKYYQEQEALIADAAEEGNMSLKATKYQIAELEQSKKDIAIELAAYNQQKSDIIDEISNIETLKEEVQREYFTQEASLDKSLANVRKDLQTAKDELKRVNEDADRKLAILKERETSIIAREDAIRKTSEELKVEKRRFDTTRNLYD